MKRVVCIVLTTRGNYGKMKSTMAALQKDNSCQLKVVIGGPLLEERYGNYSHIIENDGFKIDASVDYLKDGETLSDMVDSAGRCTEKIGRCLLSINPGIVVVVADRYEALSIAHAALCLNIPIAHIEGGEVSGSIDDKIRNAISNMADIHFPSNADSAKKLLSMGIEEEYVHVVGTPSLDLLNEVNLENIEPVQTFLDANSNHDNIDLSEEYIVVSQHPVVTEYEKSFEQYQATAAALAEYGCPVVWVLPNVDAGANEALRVINESCKNDGFPAVCTIGSMPFELYASLLFNSSCLVGNTSSGLRESAFLGIPVVNIGTRQEGRLRGRNVVDVSHDKDEILNAINKQTSHDKFTSDSLYGNAKSGIKISEVLMKLNIK